MQRKITRFALAAKCGSASAADALCEAGECGGAKAESGLTEEITTRGKIGWVVIGQLRVTVLR